MKRFARYILFAAALAVLCAPAMLAGLYPQQALALYNDQTRNFPPRYFNTYQVHYYRLTVNWNDPNISTGQQFGAIGCGAYIVYVDADVTTAFNAGTNNFVTIGVTKSSANEIVAGGTSSGTNIVGGSTGINHLTSAAGLGVPVTGNTSNQQGTTNGPCFVPLYAKYAQTGTAATAGAVTIVIGYIPNNDM